MAIITSGITTLTDLNDAIISGTQPVNPTAGTLWIDSSKSPAVLKIYKNGAWTTQDLDLNSLDPDMAESIKNVVATIGNMSNDNLLDFQERQQIKNDLTEILGKVTLDTETVLPTVAQLEVLMKGSFYSNRRNALNAGIEAGNVLYVDVATQYQNLKTYLESLTPIKPWNVSSDNKNTNITVVKDTFRDKWLQYYLATEKLSLATTEKIKEAQDDLDGKIDEVSLRDKTEILSGNPIYTDKSDDAVVHVEVDGKSEQNVATGNPNLLLNSNFINGFSGWSVGGGSITATIDSTNTYLGFNSAKLVFGAVDSTGGVHRMFQYNGGVASTGVQMAYGAYVKADKSVRVGVRISTSVDWFDVTTEWSYISGTGVGDKFLIFPEQVATIWVNQPKTELGSTATPITTPSPDYPSTINSLNSFDIVSSVGGRNYLKGTDIPLSIKGQGIVNQTGSSQGYSLNTLNGQLATLPFTLGEDWFITFDYRYTGITPSGKMYVQFNRAPYGIAVGATTFSTSNREGRIQVVFPAHSSWIGSTATEIGIRLDDINPDHTVQISNMAFFKGSSGEYSEAPEEIQYNTQSPTIYKTNILLSEPLRSVGDVKDRVFLDTDGLWKVERNVGAYTFTANEVWALETNRDDWLQIYSRPVASTVNKMSTTDGLSSHFKVVPQTAVTGNTNNIEGVNIHNRYGVTRFGVKPSTIGVTSDMTNAQKIAKFNNWIDWTKVVIQYQLEIPTIETLSAEQQTKLNNIQSFKGSNYVYTMANVTPNLNAVFKSNAWYRTNVLGEQLTYGNRNWARNGNLAYLLEDSAWSGYYKGTVREIVDISSDAPPFKNALHIKQTTSGIAGIIDAVIWEGAEANVLTGQSVSMATWLKYQNVENSDLVMQVQVTGKKSDGTFVYDYPKVFSSTGTDITWQRRTGTVKINLFEGATEITRVMFRLGFAKAGTGEFWATGIQLETGTALGDWSANPDDVQGDLDATKAQLILTEKEVALRVAKGNVVNEVNVDPTGVRIKGKKFTVDADTEFNANLTMNKGVIKSADGGTVLDLNNNTLSLDKPFSIGNTKSATTDDVGKAVDGIEISVRNLLPLSSLRDSASFNSFGESDVTASLVDGEYTLINRTSSNSGRAMFSKNAKMDILNNFAIGDNLTISADVYVESLAIDGSTIFVRFNNPSGGMIGDAWVGINTKTPKNQWVRLSGTFTIPSNADLSKTDVLRIGIQGVARFRVKNINVSKGNKDNGWSPAPEDIQAGIDSAQTEATNAKKSANTANELLADLSNDNTLTPVEKKSVKKEWDIIISEKTKIDAEATEYGITTGTERTNYNTHYNSLNGYIPPLLSNLNINSNIVGVNFRGYFKNYYDARQDLLNAITSKAKVLADSAQGTADTVKGVVSNFDSSIINANPIFLDWAGQYPAGYSSSTGGVTGTTKVASGNGMGNAVKYIVPANTQIYMNPNLVTTFPYFEYVTVEFTFKLESGTIDGAGVLFRYNATSNVDHLVKLKDIMPSPDLNKWYTVTKVIKQATKPAGFNGYMVYPMGGYSPLGTPTAKTIQFDSLKTRQATEQEINAYESSIMIADMSSDSKITPLEKVQLKKEWATIASERASLDGLAGTYNLGAEKTNMTNAYNTLSSALNGTNGILANMTATSTVVATTFRAQFDDYYEKKAILQKKVSEISKALADTAQDTANNIKTGVRNLVIRNGEKIGYLVGGGSISAVSTNRVMLNKITVTPNEVLTFTKQSTANDSYWRCDMYNSSGTYTDRMVNLSNEFQWTVPAGVYEIQVSYPNVSEVKIERGNRATGYIPAPEDVDFLVNSVSTLAGTKSQTFTTTPTTPYKSGDVWKNGTAVYISTATRASGSFTSADWVLVGDVTSNNTAKDVTNVGGTLATTIRDRATNGNTAYASTSLWKTVGKVTFDGGNLEADTITSGAIKSDVALINKLFVSDANINALTAKTAFINTVKSIDLSADRITAGTITGVNSAWNLNTGDMLFRNPSTGDTLNLNQGEISFKNGAQGRTLQYNSGGLLLRPDNNNTGTALNTGFILEGGVTFVQFNNRAGTVQHGRLQMTSDTAVLRIPNGADFLIQDMNGLQTNIGANIFKTVHGTGEVIYMQQNRIYTIRDGNRNIFLEPNGTGSVVAGNGGGTRWNMVASDFVKQSTRDSKQDIKPIETKGLDVIGRLNPVSYKKKDKVAQGIVETELGFIAEDSLEVATVDGLGIYDSHITAYLVKAVQELNAELKEMKNNYEKKGK